ncbi:MAG: flagellar basal body P-ring formation chaperone FlgA [Acidobacteriota bacterium]
MQTPEFLILAPWRLGAKTLPLLFLLCTLQAQTIRVSGPVDVASEEITLGDIARIEPQSEALADIPLGHAPYAGHYRWISRSEVEEALRKWGGESKVRLLMEDKLLVRRQSQRVTAAQLEQAVRKHFEQQESGAVFEVERIEAPSGLVVPAGFLEIEIEAPSNLGLLSNVSLKANLMLNGRLQRSVWVRAALSARQSVVVTVRDLPRGHRIQPQDVRLAQRRLKRWGSYFSQTAAVVGTVLGRSLSAQEPIPARFVKRPLAVKRGDFVTVLARGASFLVSTTGKAKGSGAVGDRIAVENLQSKKVVRAVITGDKEVQVYLPGQKGVQP